VKASAGAGANWQRGERRGKSRWPGRLRHPRRYRRNETSRWMYLYLLCGQKKNLGEACGNEGIGRQPGRVGESREGDARIGMKGGVGRVTGDSEMGEEERVLGGTL
jgi:hypothetical protein